MLRFCACLVLVLAASGCATTPEYNPVMSGVQGTYLLNESALKNVQVGQTRDQVHQLMGQEIVIGYDYQGPSGEKPITIPNPYKTEEVQTPQGACTAEYYVTSVHHPDGAVSDDELMPLVFCNGVLTSKGGPGK